MLCCTCSMNQFIFIGITLTIINTMIIITVSSYQVNPRKMISTDSIRYLNTIISVGSRSSFVPSTTRYNTKSIIVRYEGNIGNGEYDNNNNITPEPPNDEVDIDSTNMNQFTRRSGTSNEQVVSSFDTSKNYKNQFNHHKEQQRYDPLMGYTLEDLEAFAMQQKQQQMTNNGRKPIPKYTINNLPDDVNVSLDEGILLEPNEYIQSSREYSNIDGTISKDKRFFSSKDIVVEDEISVLPPIETDPTYISSIQGYIETIVTQPNDNNNNNPYIDQYIPSSSTIPTNTNQNMGRQVLSVDNPNIGYNTQQNERKQYKNVNYNNNNNDLASLDEVWTTINQLQQYNTNSNHINNNYNYNPDIAEVLHQKVFENEIGFYNQSQIFLLSLTNTTKAKEANTVRRGRYYRERQTTAIASLYQQIEEFEALLLQQQQVRDNNTEVIVHCSKCKCRMSDDEINHPSRISSNENPLCHVCNMELLVSKSKRNDMYRTQHQARARAALYTYRHAASAGSTNNNRTNSDSNAYVKPSSQSTLYQNDNTISTETKTNNDDSAIPKQQIVEPISLENDNNLHTRQITTMSSNSWTTIESMNVQQELSSFSKEEDVHHFMSDSMQGFENDDGNDDDDEQDVTSTISIYPWIEVIDPDTDEVFYWNEETGEMKWEL